MLAQKSCKLQEKWRPQSYKNLQESYKHWLARLLASLAAMQDLNLACKNLTRVMQDFYRNLARCKRESCMTTILHAHGLLLWKQVAPPISVQSTVILQDHIHTTIIIIVIVKLIVHLWSLICLQYYSRQSGSQCLSENSCGIQGACSPDQLPE